MADRNSFTLPAASWVDPAEWARATARRRERFLRRVGAIAVRLKRKEVTRGIGVDREPLYPVKPASRPDGADGKPLDPHYGQSRAFRWLRSSVAPARGAVTLWWSHGWGRILGYHRSGIRRKDMPGGVVKRDTIGLSAPSVKAATAEARTFWRQIGGKGGADAARAATQRANARAKAKAEAEAKATARAVAKRAALERAATAAAARALALGERPKATPRPKRVPAPVPVGPILPGRPIAERLAAYAEGDKKLRSIARIGGRVDKLREAWNRIDLEMVAMWDRAVAAGRQHEPETTARIDALAARAEAAYDRFRAEGKKIADKVAARLRPGVRAEWGSAPGAEGVAGLAPEQRTAAVEAMAWLNRLLRPGSDAERSQRVRWRQIPADRKQRAYAGGDRVTLGTDSDANVAVHELGHVVEDRVAGAVRAELEFLEHRRKGEPLRKFTELFPGDDFEDSEEGFKDDFGRYFSERGAYYCGKKYPNRGEAISMGLQALHSDPVGFAAKDPEFAKFVLGILDGALR